VNGENGASAAPIPIKPKRKGRIMKYSNLKRIPKRIAPEDSRIIRTTEKELKKFVLIVTMFGMITGIAIGITASLIFNL
jgi:predicted PurR-regulated permease PerM